MFENKSCRVDFRPKKRTVTVHLKGPAVTGLPKAIIEVSNKLAQDYGTKRKWTMGWDNRIFTVNTDDAGVAALRADPLVAAVKESPKVRIADYETYHNTPVQPYNPAGVNIDWGPKKINAGYAWGKGIFGQGVKLCVIDSGIQKAHPAFWNEGFTPYKGGYDFVNDTSDPEDDMDHGTWCCGIIAEQHNNLPGSFKGIAPGVDLYVCKVLDSAGSGYAADVAAGIDWAREHGLHIVSMSLGQQEEDSILEAACIAAAAAGLLLIASAGNDGPDTYPVGYPGKYDSVIAVAATDFHNRVADWSSRGSEVDVAAPGVAIVGPLAGFTYTDIAIPGSDWLYFCDSGTSAACPVVAAAAALIKSWYPAVTAAQIRTYLQNNAKDL
ncbi:MAG: S8 family serine peptidase [Candidatus Micrarchaeia archaeon]|jgi:subtilisin family serine protease